MNRSCLYTQDCGLDITAARPDKAKSPHGDAIANGPDGIRPAARLLAF